MRRFVASLCVVVGGLAIAAPAQAATAHASIIAGSNVAITTVPWQVRVLIRSGNTTYQCGGSLRDSTHVITAAHCVYIGGVLAAPANVTVGYGSANTTSLQQAAVSEVTMPAAYVNDDSYDIAVLDLAAPVNGYGGASTNGIPLASASALSTGVGAEANAFASGWGATSEGATTTPTTLKGVNLPLRADSVCSGTYSGYVSARTVCAGGKGSAPSGNPDTCQGDSGGPLALNGELAGITSYGVGCGRTLTAAAYTEVSNPEIRAVADGSAPSSSLLRGSTFAPAPAATTSSPPPATTPVSETVPPPMKDATPPTARLSRLTCTKKRRCTFTIRASDFHGRVAKLSASVSRKVTTCRRRSGHRVCTTSTRKKALKPKRISGGFSATATLVKARYTLTAVATDAAGNRSKTLTKRFRETH